MDFWSGAIKGVTWQSLPKFNDGRGWLCELFRDDELPAEFKPAMGYVSETLPGITRGPHEHIVQSDCFCFVGPSDFQVILWDNRRNSQSYLAKQGEVVGQTRPMLVIIPPGVVHAYSNIGPTPGWVFNFPNLLYKGVGRRDPVDEIRHESDPNTVFKVRG